MAGYRTVALTVSTAIFMQFLDGTALGTALPAMGRDLDIPAVDLNVTIVAYQLSLASLIPIGSIAADRMGARNAFVMSLLVFLTGSLFCAMSRTLPELIVSRTFQGMGGAVMMPVSRQLVISSSEKHEFVSALNWLLIPGIIGPLAGPMIGGLIVTYWSWHWIFLINLPVGLIGIAVTLALVPNKGERKVVPIDIKGMLLIAVAVSCVIFGLEGLAHTGSHLEPVALLAAGLLLGLVYVRHTAGSHAPALDLSLFRIASFRHSLIAGAMLRMILGAAAFIQPLWFQLAIGMTAAQAGLLIAVGAVGTLLCRFLGSSILRIAHPRNVAMVGAALVVVALLLTSLLGPDLPASVFGVALLVQGAMISAPLMVLSAVAYVDIPPDRLGAATGLFTMIQQLSLSLGVTTGVWAISVMQRFALGGADSLTYSGSHVILAGLAALAIHATGKIDHKSFHALRAKAAAT